jgi:hypothetical protein
MDTFDFCTELTDLSRAPFDLDCLQKEWRNQGGQPAGTDYPTTNNIAQWNGIGTWGNVRKYITSLKQLTKSTNMNVQSLALQRFLGIRRRS